MSSVIEGLIFAWEKNKDYAVRLVSDLSDDQMCAQPSGATGQPANHPAWVLSHLNVYVPIVGSVIEGEAFEDPKGHQFGMQSKPESEKSLYASREELINEYVAGHDAVTALLRQADESIFSNPVQLERWKPVMPTAGITLPYLMLVHENVHLGQVSAWRRVQGMRAV
ncbi:MAG: DinB family protein [Planctomycetota bacterium]